MWGRLIFRRAQAPAVNYPKASVPRAPQHSGICTYELNICGYNGPTMFDLSLLRTLGQVWVSLGTSQVHWHDLCEFKDFTGLLSMICVSLGTPQVHRFDLCEFRDFTGPFA